MSVLFSQLLLVKVYEEEGHTAEQDASGAERKICTSHFFVNRGGSFSQKIESANPAQLS